MKTNSPAEAGSTGMEDHNPLKTQKLIETQKTVSKLIQSTQKKYPPKTLEAFPSMVTNSSIAGKNLYGLHQGSKM
jgi:hypothetical protein